MPHALHRRPSQNMPLITSLSQSLLNCSFCFLVLITKIKVLRKSLLCSPPYFYLCFPTFLGSIQVSSMCDQGVHWESIEERMGLLWEKSLKLPPPRVCTHKNTIYLKFLGLFLVKRLAAPSVV